MTSLEHDQLLPTTEIVVTLACFTYMCIVAFFVLPIDIAGSYTCIYCCIIIPDLFQDTVRTGTMLQNWIISMCDVDSHVIIFTGPSQFYFYCNLSDNSGGLCTLHVWDLLCACVHLMSCEFRFRIIASHFLPLPSPLLLLKHFLNLCYNSVFDRFSQITKFTVFTCL